MADMDNPRNVNINDKGHGLRYVICGMCGNTKSFVSEIDNICQRYLKQTHIAVKNASDFPAKCYGCSFAHALCNCG